MFRFPELNKVVFISILSAAILTAGLSWKYCAYSASSPSDENIVAVANNNISVTKSELDQAIAQYKEATKKKELTKEEEIGLVKNLIRRQLILQLDKVKAYRKDPEIIEKVKAYEDTLVVSRYLEQVIGSKLTVSEQETRAYYDKNIHQFSSPPKVEASQILLRTRKDAEMVLKKLHQGADFAQLAKDYSIDLPMALKGGPMGTIQKGRSLPQLDKALFLLAKGETSGIIKTRFGYHILRVDKVIPENFKPYDEVYDQIKKTLLLQKEKKAFVEMVQKLEAKADIKIFENRLNSKVEKTAGKTN